MANLNPATYHRSTHVPEDSLKEASIYCPICNSIDRKVVAVLQKNPDVFLMKCNTCLASSASRIPSEDALDKYYKECYEDEGSDRITFDNVSRFGDYLSSFYVRHNKKNEVSILDFGGGDGSIAYAVATKLIFFGVTSIDITVVDYGNNVIQKTSDSIRIVKSDSLDKIDCKFDFVIASAVLEHIQEPDKIINILLSKLNRGGLFYARTPYVAPLINFFSRIGVSIDFTYPAHLHDLGQDFWEKYFSKKTNSFSVLKSKPSIVQTSFKDNFMQTTASYIFKFPWFMFGRRYKLVGGWEVFCQKK